MCFSPEASFTAGAVLTIAGIVLTNKFHDSKLILLALIPLFFGLQQLSEGVVWVALRNGWYPDVYSLAAQDTYLFFADMLWPVWLPLAFGIVEKVLWRKIVFGILLLLGIAFALKIADISIVYGTGQATVINHSINYGESPSPYRIVYAIITLLPFLLTSIPKMWILGIVYLVAFTIAEISYTYAFVSIWCFVAAIITIGLFVLLYKNADALQQKQLNS